MHRQAPLLVSGLETRASLCKHHYRNTRHCAAFDKSKGSLNPQGMRTLWVPNSARHTPPWCEVEELTAARADSAGSPAQRNASPSLGGELNFTFSKLNLGVGPRKAAAISVPSLLSPWPVKSRSFSPLGQRMVEFPPPLLPCRPRILAHCCQCTFTKGSTLRQPQAVPPGLAGPEGSQPARGPLEQAQSSTDQDWDHCCKSDSPSRRLSSGQIPAFVVQPLHGVVLRRVHLEASQTASNA